MASYSRRRPTGLFRGSLRSGNLMTFSIKPRSILQLTITGFLAVTGLLIAALVVTAEQLDGLSDRSQRVISQSASAMRASRILIEQMTAMERNIRQYRILEDAEILKVYANRRITFTEVAVEVEQLKLDDEITEYVNTLLANEIHEIGRASCRERV